MVACAKTLRSTRHRKQQTKHHRHPNYRHHIIAHHAHWIAPSTPLWSRHFRSGTILVETGGNFGGSSGSSFVDAFPVSKGVIWLLIATFAEVTPVVCPGFVSALYFSHYSTLQVFICLDLNGICLSARSVDDELVLNSRCKTQIRLTLYVFYFVALTDIE